MNKDNLVEVIKTIRDVPFLQRLVLTIVEQLPKGSQIGIARKLYIDHVHVGDVYTFTHVHNGRKYMFISKQEVYDFFAKQDKRMNDALLERLVDGETIYDYVFCVEGGETNA